METEFYENRNIFRIIFQKLFLKTKSLIVFIFEEIVLFESFNTYFSEFFSEMGSLFRKFSKIISKNSQPNKFSRNRNRKQNQGICECI